MEIQREENDLRNDSTILELKKFIDKSVTPFHTIQSVKEILNENGFEELKMNGCYEIRAGGKYYIDVYGSSMLAFSVGEDFKSLDNSRKKEKRGCLRCTSSHTDFPGFKLKPNAEICVENINGNHYVKLNTEVYGGPILNTWLDRPLSLGGRLVLRGNTAFEPTSVLVDIGYALLTIPNLAIHMNRDVNKGVELNRQKDMLPLVAVAGVEEYKKLVPDNKFSEDRSYEDKNGEKSDIILDILLKNEIADKKINRNDIIDYELFVYSCDNGESVGINGELFSSPRLDNLTSVFAQTKALINSERKNGINAAMYFDNEEIGSRTKQGAASQTMLLLLEKIYQALGFDRQKLTDDIFSGMMISCDVAHAVHPNAPEKSDITNKVMLNNGIVIKQAASQSYANDAFTISVVKQICKENGVGYQTFVNRSDTAGGQTLGSVGSTVMPFPTIDIGIPLLAMHSSRELMGTADQKLLEKFLTGYYS